MWVVVYLHEAELERAALRALQRLADLEED